MTDPTHKILIRPVVNLKDDCTVMINPYQWCAMHVDVNGWETGIISTGLGLMELIKLLPPGKATIVIPEQNKNA